MTTMTKRQNEHLATALVLEGCETGRRLESIIAAEKALRTDPRCPEAMLVVMDQDEVRQLVSSDYVRLGLSKAVLDETERRLNRVKRRPDEEDPSEFRVMESAFRRAAKAYAACLSELGHHGEASQVYLSLTRRLPAEGREAAYLRAILDLRHGNRAGFARLKRNLAALPHFTKQRVLSFFTRPGRDLNHRLITEIADGQRWPSEPAATPAEAQAFIGASLRRRPMSAEDFVDMSPAGGPRERKHLLLLDWWAAGQGLFASGMISRHGAPPLIWVYDCGTTSSKNILTQSRKSFERQYNSLGGQHIQLAVLSHFDTDHLSGLIDLLGFARIQTLLLPYVPAWRRLVYALEQGVDPTAPEFDFFLNPAAYIATVADGRIERIVFVSPSQPDELPPETPDAPLVPAPEGDRLKDVKLKELWIDEGPPPPD